MPARNIEVVIKVRDSASQKLDELEKKTKKAGKGANKASLDFKKFNRTLFATTAFVGTFIKTFSTLTQSLNAGAELDRVDRQFERVLGPSGKMLMNIRGLTDAAVDSMEAMRAGIALSNSGITSNSQDTARIIAMSAAAARRAGLDTTEGIKRVVQFTKSGSVASLEFLNLVRTTDPAFTAQIELLKQAGGALGGTLSIQQKVAIGMRALELASRGNMKGQRDLQDVLKGVTDSYGIMRKTLGRLIGTALTPLIDSVTNLFYRMSIGIENIRKNNKELVFLTKAVIVSTASVLGLAGALGTLRLASMALGSLGFGLPKLIFLTGVLGSSFLGLTDNADSVMDKFKVFGAFVQGIYQLITSFDEESGIGKIDARLKRLLQENKIFQFAKIVARGGVLVKKTLTDIVDVATDLAKSIDNIFGNTFRTIIDKISEFNKPWDKALLSAENKWKRIAGIVALVGGGFALKKLLGTALSRVPVVGKLFGAGGKGPKGTATDPLFVTMLGGLGGIPGFGGKFGGLGKFGGAAKAAKAAGGIGAAAIGGLLIGHGINKLADRYTTQQNQFGQTTNVFERLAGKSLTFLPESLGGISQKDYEDVINQGPTVFAGSGEKTSAVNVPTPDNTIAHLDAIGEQMQNVDRAEAKKLQLATEAALATGQEGAGIITEEEMIMLSNSFGSAIDNSKVMNAIRDNTTKGPTAGPGNRRP